MEEKRHRLIAGTPIMVTGTRHHAMRGTVEADRGNFYVVQLDEWDAPLAFYHHQLIPYPELQTFEPYE